LLAACGRPLLPVLNFVNAPAHRADEWRDAMSRLGLHAALEFDTVAPPIDGERQLYAKLAVLLDRHADTLHRLADELARQRRERTQTAWQFAADLLIDVAALRITSPADNETLDTHAATLRDRVRQREQACVDALLALYNFHRSDVTDNDLPLTDAR